MCFLFGMGVGNPPELVKYCNVICKVCNVICTVYIDCIVLNAMTPDQATEILRLRAAKVAPKQIARNLGLRPAEVKTFIQEHAEELYLKQTAAGTQNSVYECLINQGAADHLLAGNSKEKEGTGGLAQVILARQEKNRIISASYLVDYWCLGVKDVIAPDKMGKRGYERLKGLLTENFREPFVDISLEQAQSIIYGAVDYARTLGLEPTRDFDPKAQMHLGPRPESLIPIKFGKDGKPFFISGPYDDVEKIVQTLTHKVGADNFHYLMPLEGFGDELNLLE
jgi:hypothetical protein